MDTSRRTDAELTAIAAWSFAHAVLWKNDTFTEREVLHHQWLISEQLEANATTEQNLIRFCVRVVMAKRYCEENPEYQLTRPGLWFNRKYDYGYVVTKSWYEKLVEKRQQIAGYGQPIFLLARGYAKYVQDPSREIFLKYRERLLHLKAKRIAQVFYNSVVYFNYQF